MEDHHSFGYLEYPRSIPTLFRISVHHFDIQHKVRFHPIQIKYLIWSSKYRLHHSIDKTRFNNGMSSQPHLLGRPVVTPNSFPSVRSNSPFSPVSSVGKGPDPTRVMYALAIPMTC